MKEKLVLIICKLSDGQPLSRGESRLWRRHRQEFDPVFREKFDKDLYQEMRTAQDRAGEAWLRFKEQRLGQLSTYPQAAVVALQGSRRAGRWLPHWQGPKPVKSLAAVAVLAAALAVGSWYWQKTQQVPITLAEKEEKSKPAPAPAPAMGTEWTKASLTLGDKRTIELGQNVNNTVVHEGAVTVQAGSAGISYLPESDSVKPCQHELKTPRAGQYQVQLSDGSSVMLNAETVLRYPTRFTGSTREVQLLRGEAYFTVTKNEKQPFVIKSNNIAILVTGTQFNCSAYDNEDNVTTTLVEGKVTIMKNDHPYALNPGEQARYDKKHRHVMIGPVSNLDEAIAWKNGYFSFNNTPLSGIAKSIERWYNVTVVVQPGLQAKTYTHKRIQKNARLEELLGAITGSLGIRYKNDKGIIYLYE